MIQASVLPEYLTALAAVYVIPGPDMALVMATAAGSGTRAGLYSTAGLAAARFIHVMASGLGMATLLSSQPVLLHAVHWIGAAYFVWLAWKLLGGTRGEGCHAAEVLSPWAAVLRGFATNLLNPKALFFCGLLLPQFVSRDRGPLLPQFVSLGLLLVITGWLFDIVYALGAGGLVRRYTISTKIGRARNLIMGLVFLALAVRFMLA